MHVQHSWRIDILRYSMLSISCSLFSHNTHNSHLATQHTVECSKIGFSLPPTLVVGHCVHSFLYLCRQRSPVFLAFLMLSYLSEMLCSGQATYGSGLRPCSSYEYTIAKLCLWSRFIIFGFCFGLHACPHWTQWVDSFFVQKVEILSR